MDLASIMSPAPICVGPDASAADAAARMDEHDIRHLPVVEDGRPIGVLSDRELFEAAPDQRARELMHAPAVTAGPKDSPADLPSEIALRKLGCVLVVEGDALVGIVSQFDVVRAFVDAVEADGSGGLDDPLVKTHMIEGFERVAPGETLGHARTRMRETFVRHLPLVQDGRALGMLSDRDLRRARGRGATDEERVEEHASKPARSISPDARLSQAGAAMHAGKLGALLVVQEERVFGLLTLSDLLDHCTAELNLRAS